MKPSINDSNTVQAFWIGIGSLSTFAFTLVSSAILSRYLNKADYGTYKQVMYIYNTLLFVFTLGLPKAYSYFLPRYSINQGRNIIKKINYIFIIMGVIFSSVFFLGAGLISKALNNEDLITPLKYFALSPTFLLPTIGLDGIMSVYKKAYLNATYLIITRIVMLIFVCAPVIFFEPNCNYAIIGFTASSFICLLLTTQFFKIPFVNIKSIKAELKYQEIFAFSIPLLFASIGGVAIKAADQFFVSRYFGSEVFAEFSNGSLELPFVTMVLNAGATILLPIFSGMLVYSSNKKSEILALWEKSLIKSALILYPLVIYCFFFSNIIMIFLYGEAYEGSSLYFRIMLIINVFTVAQYYPIIIAMGATKYYAKVHIIIAIFVWLSEYLIVTAFPKPYLIAIVSVIYSIIKIQIMASFIANKLETSILKLFPIKNLLKNLLVCTISCAIIHTVYSVTNANVSHIIILMATFITYLMLTVIVGNLFKVDYLSVIKPLISKIK